MSYAKKEEEILEYWDKNQIFQKSLEKLAPKGPFVFYDGPPFATGLPHYGHIVASVLKDAVPRFWTMRGYHVDRKWGWDCHGLPIENIVEKKFDLNSKRDIEEMGVGVFNDRCHAEVMAYAQEWKKVIRRLGRWVDMENDYKTMDLSFMESIWWVFKQLWEKDFIYQGHKPIHICPRCETAISKFEVNQGYEMVKDISVFVSFPLTSGPYEGVNLLAWTTTPWTLPGNVLAAVKDDLDYVQVSHEGASYVVVKERLEDVFEGKEYVVEKTLKGAELVGATYKPLFDFYADHEGGFRVVSADFVTTEDGTGVVHIAPGFGEDDYELGKTLGVEPIFHVQMNGQFVEEIQDSLSEAGYDVKGVPAKAKGETMKLDIEIVKALAHAGRLFKKQKLEHSYPHCWRCDTPLLNYATGSWFVRVSKQVPSLVEQAKDIRWVPEHIKEGRFGKGLEASPDWSISRSRFWGTPLPVWMSEDGDVHVVGSVAELEELTGTTIDNLHKQHVDALTFEKDGKVYTRIPEVLDCWFESGSMPYAQMHYPFENKELFEQGFPAQFIAEGVDQTSLWFHKLHVIANMLFGTPAYKNVVVNGIVLAEDGKKMSKRLQNYPDPMEVIEKYGADSVRYYLMSSPVVRAENLRFSEKEVAEVSKKFVNIASNVLSFYQLYKEMDDGRDPDGEHVLDRWILVRLSETYEVATAAMEGYDLQQASRVLQDFVTDLSTWYVRRSRDRVKVEGEEQKQALATLRVCLETFAKLTAPFTPMLAEILWLGVDDGRESVHLQAWPEVVYDFEEELVLGGMTATREVVRAALERRVEAGIGIRQVLGGMTINVVLDEAHLGLVAEELNVKFVSVDTDQEAAVVLDTELTPELKREGLSREIIRRVNTMRKKAGLTIEDRIVVYVSGGEGVALALEEHGEVIARGVLAESIQSSDAPENVEEMSACGFELSVGFVKM